MAKSIIDVIKDECKEYVWGESDCISLLERIYEYKFTYSKNTISFKLPWLYETNHAKAIALAKRNFGSLLNAYEKSLLSLDFFEVCDKLNTPCVFITKDKVVLYLKRFLNEDSKTYKFNLSNWHGAILGILIKHDSCKYHLIYQLDGIYEIKNYMSIYKYFDHRACL